MNKTQQAHQFSLVTWASRFQNPKDSSLAVKAWCEQNNISIYTYNYWKPLVKQEYLEAVLSPYTPEIVPITPPALSTVSNALNSIGSLVSDKLSDSSFIKIELPSIYIRLDSSVSVDKMIHILKAVRHA